MSACSFSDLRTGIQVTAQPSGSNSCVTTSVRSMTWGAPCQDWRGISDSTFVLSHTAALGKSWYGYRSRCATAPSPGRKQRHSLSLLGSYDLHHKWEGHVQGCKRRSWCSYITHVCPQSVARARGGQGWVATHLRTHPPLAARWAAPVPSASRGISRGRGTPDLPTKIIPTKIRWLESSGEFPMDMWIPPLTIKILLESNPLRSRILVRRLAVGDTRVGRLLSLSLSVYGRVPKMG